MKTISLVTIFFGILSGCASFEANDQNDVDNILGVWHLKDYGHSNYQFSLLAFTDTGRKCVLGYEMSADGSVNVDYYDSFWSIENGYLISVVGDSPSSSLPKGYAIRDEIKVLTDSNMNLLMESNSSFVPELERHQKLNGASPGRICEVIENYSASIKVKHNK